MTAQEFEVESGANFLAKPFSLQKLAETIRACLDAPRRRDPD
jgi:hypothetical protein